jgi:BirA family biotin operon repressor/biotin-[acetyl-CoA-carboxylase] ligase
MPAGNFAATLVLTCSQEDAALRSFVAALALYETCVEITGNGASLALKWPNDVLLNEGKLAGILLEGVNQAPHRFGLAIGIGVNLATAPEASELEPLALPPVSLAENCGVSISPVLFLEHLAKHYAVYEEQLCTHGFAAIRRAWLARAARVGQRITARLPQEDITGVFETIDDAGCMILQTPQGSRKIAAGDIYFEREMIHASGD